MKIALLSASLVAFTLAPSANAAWQRLGSIEKRPIDGATSSLSGTKIVASKGIGQPENLLSDDVALSSKVNPGVSDTTIGLGRQIVVELVSLINDGAEGRIAVEGSLDNHKWTALSKSVCGSGCNLLRKVIRLALAAPSLVLAICWSRLAALR